MSYSHSDNVYDDPDYPERFGNYNYGPYTNPYSYYPNPDFGAYYYGYTPPPAKDYPNGEPGGCKCGSASPPKNPPLSEDVPGGYEQETAPPLKHPFFSFYANLDKEAEDVDGYDFGYTPALPPDENPAGFEFGPSALPPQYPPDEEPQGFHFGTNIGTAPPSSPKENRSGCNCRPMPPHPPHPPHPPFPPFPFCKHRKEECDPQERCSHKHHKNEGMACCPKPRNCVHQNICQRFCVNDLAKLCKVELKGTAIHNCEERICLSYKIIVEYLDCCGRKKTFCRNAIIQFPRPLKCGPCEHYRVDIANPPHVQVCGKELTVRTSVEICCRL